MMVVKNGLKEYQRVNKHESDAERKLKELKLLLDRHGVGDMDASLMIRIRGLINQNVRINRDRARLSHQKILLRQEIRHLNAQLENRPTYGLTNEQVIEIVYRHEDGETYRQIAKDYKVSPQTIGRIVRAYKKEIA